MKKIKLFEKKLFESEERYKAIFCDNILPLLIIDPKTGDIIEANLQSCKFYGYSKEEFSRLKIFDVNMLSEREVRKSMQKVNFSNQNYFLFKHKLADGRIRDVEVCSGKIKIDGRELLLSTISDVTDKLKVEQQLKKSEQDLKAVLDATDDIYFLIDKNCRIIGFNKVSENYARIVRNKKLKLGDDMLEYMDSLSIDDFKKNFKRCLRGELIEVERELFDLYGKSYWFKTRYLPVYNPKHEIYAVSFNSAEITNRKKIERQLIRVSNIVEKSLISVFLWKSEKGWPVEYVTDNVSQIFGYTKEDFVSGKINYEQIIHPEDLKRVLEEVAFYNTKQNDSFEHKPYRIINKDGMVKWIKDATTIQRDENGNALFYEGIIVEITEQEEFKQALQISENRLNAAMEASEIGLWDWDLLNHKIYYSTGWSKIIGCDETDITNRISFWKDRIHVNDRSRTIDNILYHLRNKSNTHQSEHRLKRKDNTYIWVLGKGRVIERDTNGKPTRVVGTIEDIDFRKRSELALKESEEKYRKVLENINLIGIILDKKGNLIFVNKYMLNLTGWKEHEIINKNWFDLFVPEENRENLREFFLNAFCDKDGFPINKTNQIHTKKGEIRTVSWSNTVNFDKNKGLFSVTSIGEDITEQEKNRIALQISEERLKTAIEATEIGLWDWNCLTNEVYYSPGWIKILDIPKHKITNDFHLWESRLHPEDKKNTLNVLNKHLNMETDSFYSEYRLRHQNGNWIWVLGKGKVIERDENHKPIRAIGTMEKISKRIYDTIISAEERERKRIAENLHDELGPLLSAAKLYLEAIKYNKKIKVSNQSLDKFEEIINDAIERSQEIANNVSPHILKNFGLESALGSFCKKVSESKKVSISLKSLIKSHLKESIEISLYRVIIELINNTIKHANASMIKIFLDDKDNYLFVKYEDDGIGFDINKTLDNQEGMGLINILNRIEIIDGKCKLNSKPNQGIRIDIEIPLDFHN